jgi:hypothetical protein
MEGLGWLFDTDIVVDVVDKVGVRDGSVDLMPVEVVDVNVGLD